MPELIYGYHCVERLPEILHQFGTKDIFVITSRPNKEIITRFLDGFNHVLWVNKTSLPVMEEAEVIFSEYQRNHSGILLAVGGGVVLDYAKSVVYNCLKNNLTPPAFIAIPTVAGSGSEATHFAVIYHSKSKYSLVDKRLKPTCVFLDASFLHTMTPRQKATSGMDIISQAVESWWSKHSNIYTRVFSEAALKLWRIHFDKYVNNSDQISAEKIMIASNLAGVAIDFTKTTAPHALSYYLTSYHGVPHGLAVGLLLPVFVLYNHTDKELCELLNCSDQEELYQYLIFKLKEFGLPTKLRELNIDKYEIIDEWLDHADKERFNNNPESFNKVVLKEYLLNYI